MTRPPRPPLPRLARSALLTTAVAMGAAGLGACTDEGDKDAFCERIADTPALGETLGALDSSDPGGARRQLQETARQFRELEGDAPGEVREDIARVRRGVDLILDAVEQHPDDISAARAAITEQADELVGLANAAAEVVSYAERECGVSLAGLDDPAGVGGSGTTPGTTDPTATTDPSSTTTGG